MKFAFCLYKYFPYGGQQRDFLRIANSCIKRGHHVDVYTASWEGDIPNGFQIYVLPIKGFTNHRRRESLAENLKKYVASKSYNAVIGFYKMPGLDIYFAADSCFAAKALEKSIWYRMTPRCRSCLDLERAVFGRHSETHILLISEQEKKFYMDYYGTQEKRFHFLPPGISKDRIAPKNFSSIRTKLREELNIRPDQKIVLMVGSGFKTKGVDRAIRAVAALPSVLKEKTLLIIVGKDNSRPFTRLARRLDIVQNLHFTGGRDDVPRFLVTADLLLHPAYRETAGMVLLEAMAAELPVLATDVCGYSYHIERAAAGELLPSPFKQEKLNQLLESMLTSEKREQWRRNGGKYIANTDVFSLPEKAVDIIEKVSK